MSSFFTIIYAILAFMIFIIAMAGKKHGKYAGVFSRFAAIVAAGGGFLLYGCAYAELSDSLPIAIVNTMYATIKMFLVSDQFSDIQSASFMSREYMVVCFWILHLLALYTTANAMLATLGAPLRKALRVLFNRSRKQLVMIYGITEKTVTFGRELAGDNQKFIVYIDKKSDANLLDAITELDGLFFTNDAAIKAEEKFLKSIGVNRKKQISVYALSGNEADNVRFAVNLKESFEKMGIPAKNTAVTLLANMELPYGTALQAFQEQYGYGSATVMDEAYLAARTLVKNYPPCNYVEFDEKEAKAKDGQSFTAVIIGFGKVGQAVLKNLVLNGQFENCGFHVYIYDPNYKCISGYICKNNACMMEHYDIKVVEESGQSQEFYHFLEKEIKAIQYIVVSTGNPERNNEIAMELQRTILRCNAKTEVFQCSYENIICQHRNVKGGLEYKVTENYTSDNLDIRLADSRAMKLNHMYCKGSSKWDDWNKAGFVERMSCRASADFATAFLRMVGYSEEEVLKEEKWKELSTIQLENLSRTEHLRWCAFYYSIGYRKMPEMVFRKRCNDYAAEKASKGYSSIKIQKDSRKQMHICLVSWDELDELTAEYRKITGDNTKDYKQDDTNNVLMLPELLKE